MEEVTCNPSLRDAHRVATDPMRVSRSVLCLRQQS